MKIMAKDTYKSIKEKDKMNENMSFLSQLIKALEEAGLKLEEFYEKKDYKNFDKAKKLILQIQKKISEELI